MTHTLDFLRHVKTATRKFSASGARFRRRAATQSGAGAGMLDATDSRIRPGAAANFSSPPRRRLERKL
jgi:hypothetical protein